MDTELFKLIPNRKLYEELRHKLKHECVLRSDFVMVNEDRHNLQDKVDNLTTEVAGLKEELASSDARLKVALTENKRLKQMMNELEQAKEGIAEELKEYKERVESLNREVDNLKEEIKSMGLDLAKIKEEKKTMDLDLAKLKEEKKSLELDLAKKMEESTKQTDNHENVANKDKHLRRIQSDKCFPARAVSCNTASNNQQIQNWIRSTAKVTSTEESWQEVQKQHIAGRCQRPSTSATRISAGSSGCGTNDSDTISENSEDRILGNVNNIRGLVKELQTELKVRTDNLSGGSQCGQEIVKMKWEVGHLRWNGDQNSTDDSLSEITVGSTNTDGVRSQQSSSTNSQSTKSDLHGEATSLTSSDQNLDEPSLMELNRSRKVKYRHAGHTREGLYRRRKLPNAKKGNLSARDIDLSHVEDLQVFTTRNQSPKRKSAWSDVSQSNSPRTRTNTRYMAHNSKFIQSLGSTMLSGNASLSQSMKLPKLHSNLLKKGSTGAYIGPPVATIEQPESCLRPQQQIINRS